MLSPVLSIEEPTTEQRGSTVPLGGPVFLGHPPDTAIPVAEAAVASAGAAPTVRFRWPLRMQDWWHHAMYVDLDGASPGILDYDCESVTYDGHFGNDTLIEDFVSQDEGRYVLAAAPGTVTAVGDGNYDRRTAWIPGAQANYVILQHDDGTDSIYLHFKKWSTLVHPGEEVREGQPLGLVGSSGFSLWPHVHFEVQNAGTVYEPFTGACRTGDSLWQDQMSHVLNGPVTLLDSGTTTTEPIRAVMMERPPVVTHVRQTSGVVMYLWVRLLDLDIGDQSRVIVRRPDSVVWYDNTFVHPEQFGVSWWYWGFGLPSSGFTGTWTVEYLLNGMSQVITPFEYDGSSPVLPAGTSQIVTVDRGVFRGALQATEGENGIKWFRISSPPTHGNLVLHGPRQRDFEYVPDSGYSGMDVMKFDVEDGHLGVSIPRNVVFNVSPMVSNALRLTGEEDYLSILDNGSLDLNGGFTVEAWIKRTAGSAGDRFIVDRRPPSASSDFGYHFFVTNQGILRLFFGTGVSQGGAIGSTPLPLERWIHVAGTWDGTWVRLYVDGQEDGAGFFNGSVSYTGVGETRIGGSFEAGKSFRGELDEVRIWDVARTPAELAAGSGCAFLDAPPPASLKARWPLENGTDATANGNDGTLFAPAPTPGFDPNPTFVRTDGALRLDCPGTDSDGDTLANSVDNCPLAPNLTQVDTDSDGWGDACDLCAALSDVRQVDSDGDGVGDPCDGCPFTGDTAQVDSDTDGSGDLCDPAPANAALGVPSDGLALSLAAGPGAGETTVSWNAEPLSATYEVARGSLDEIRDRFYGSCQNSRDPDTTDTSFVEDELPATGELFGFVVLGVAADGTRGLAGPDSDGRQRDFRAKDCL